MSLGAHGPDVRGRDVVNLYQPFGSLGFNRYRGSHLERDYPYLEVASLRRPDGSERNVLSFNELTPDQKREQEQLLSEIDREIAEINATLSALSFMKDTDALEPSEVAELRSKLSELNGAKNAVASANRLNFSSIKANVGGTVGGKATEQKIAGALEAMGIEMAQLKTEFFVETYGEISASWSMATRVEALAFENRVGKVGFSRALDDFNFSYNNSSPAHTYMMRHHEGYRATTTQLDKEAKERNAAGEKDATTLGGIAKKYGIDGSEEYTKLAADIKAQQAEIERMRAAGEIMKQREAEARLEQLRLQQQRLVEQQLKEKGITPTEAERKELDRIAKDQQGRADEAMKAWEKQYQAARQGLIDMGASPDQIKKFDEQYQARKEAYEKGFKDKSGADKADLEKGIRGLTEKGQGHAAAFQLIEQTVIQKLKQAGAPQSVIDETTVHLAKVRGTLEGIDDATFTKHIAELKTYTEKTLAEVKATAGVDTETKGPVVGGLNTIDRFAALGLEPKPAGAKDTEKTVTASTDGKETKVGGETASSRLAALGISPTVTKAAVEEAKKVAKAVEIPTDVAEAEGPKDTPKAKDDAKVAGVTKPSGKAVG